MKIKYTPTITNGVQALPDRFNKYGVDFEAGKATEVIDSSLIDKMLTCPYFSEQIDFVERVPAKKATRKKRTVKAK